MLQGESSLRRVLAKNLEEVRERIGTALDRGGRTGDPVTLVAVVKETTVAVARALVAIGVSDLGESRVVEARKKRTALDEGAGDTNAAGDTVPADLRWHLIGHLQTNKVRRAVELFDLIHSVDSTRLLAALSDEAQSKGRAIEALLQVNVSGEKTKHGFSPDEVLTEHERLLSRGGVAIRGLMTMAPYSDDPEDSRPFFRSLRELREELSRRGARSLDILSMGMTGDFEVAVEEGATHVRVGTLLLRGTDEAASEERTARSRSDRA
jgi:hypothetical protein